MLWMLQTKQSDYTHRLGVNDTHKAAQQSFISTFPIISAESEYKQAGAELGQAQLKLGLDFA